MGGANGDSCVTRSSDPNLNASSFLDNVKKQQDNSDAINGFLFIKTEGTKIKIFIKCFFLS